ncbi:MAG: type IV toxin-antitoxin system AbiEi family antitoxin domain-containing protein [Bacteroidetes bacterium]|nr:type IV toxin-antitoxin system AbiEi family antitoxin domain-containing protein [Bacteroidota bacterium]
MNNKAKLLELARKRGMIGAKDAESVGISRNYLYLMYKEGLLVKTVRGLYTLPEISITEHWQLCEVAKRVPNSVVCLISALSFHGITTQIPYRIWIAIPRGAWHPVIEYPPLNLTYVSGDAYSFGVEDHDVNGVAIHVYSPAKTVADCFKFRNKVGLDVAIEAMRETWRYRKATVAQLIEAAEVNRVAKVMRPYLEATV